MYEDLMSVNDSSHIVIMYCCILNNNYQALGQAKGAVINYYSGVIP